MVACSENTFEGTVGEILPHIVGTVFKIPKASILEIHLCPVKHSFVNFVIIVLITLKRESHNLQPEHFLPHLVCLFAMERG
jgi:hypothetical protein